MQTTTAHKALKVAAAAAIAYPRPSAPKRAKEDRGTVAVVTHTEDGPRVFFWGQPHHDARWGGLAGGLRTALRLQTESLADLKVGDTYFRSPESFYCLVRGKWVPV